MSAVSVERLTFQMKQYFTDEAGVAWRGVGRGLDGQQDSAHDHLVRTNLCVLDTRRRIRIHLRWVPPPAMPLVPCCAPIPASFWWFLMLLVMKGMSIDSRNQMRIEQGLNRVGRGRLLSSSQTPSKEWADALNELNSSHVDETPEFNVSCLYSLLRLNSSVSVCLLEFNDTTTHQQSCRPAPRTTHQKSCRCSTEPSIDCNTSSAPFDPPFAEAHFDHRGRAHPSGGVTPALRATRQSRRQSTQPTMPYNGSSAPSEPAARGHRTNVHHGPIACENSWNLNPLPGMECSADVFDSTFRIPDQLRRSRRNSRRRRARHRRRSSTDPMTFNLERFNGHVVAIIMKLAKTIPLSDSRPSSFFTKAEDQRIIGMVNEVLHRRDVAATFLSPRMASNNNAPRVHFANAIFASRHKRTFLPPRRPANAYKSSPTPAVVV
jgi:hypothetical protein